PRTAGPGRTRTSRRSRARLQTLHLRKVVRNLARRQVPEHVIRHRSVVDQGVLVPVEVDNSHLKQAVIPSVGVRPLDYRRAVPVVEPVENLVVPGVLQGVLLDNHAPLPSFPSAYLVSSAVSS